MKKEHLSDIAKRLNEKSDEGLIDFITDNSSHSDGAKSILDKRMKRSIQFLTEVIQKNSNNTKKYNKILASLTKWILVLTAIMTIVTIISILND